LLHLKPSPDYQARSKTFTALACLDFFYPSLSDCQRSSASALLRRILLNLSGYAGDKKLVLSPWFQARLPPSLRYGGQAQPTFGFDLQRLPATPKVAWRPLLRLLIPASTEGLYSRSGKDSSPIGFWQEPFLKKSFFTKS
jgi:hypothetical protein